MKNIKILVACHKSDPHIRQNDIYMPIQVGKEIHPEIDLGFQCDNEGKNISHKNDKYCELTALYWAWKNLKNIEFIGLCHYRRYFDYNINLKNISEDLQKYDAIAVKPKITYYPTEVALSHLLTREEVTLTFETLLEIDPQYKHSIIEYYFKNNKSSRYNMFIMNWHNFNEYCEFIFDILLRLENKFKPHNYTRLKRNLGYIAESLLGFYFFHKKMKIKYVEIVEPKKRNKKRIRLMRLRNNLIFKLISKPTKIKIFESVIMGLNGDKIPIKNLLSSDIKVIQ